MLGLGGLDLPYPLCYLVLGLGVAGFAIVLVISDARGGDAQISAFSGA